MLRSNNRGPDSLTLAAFVLMTVIAGANFVAVRFSNRELPPFWGAFMRFTAAAAIFWVILLVMRHKLPRGRALAGALIYGALSFGASYAFLYWGLVYVTAGAAAISLALVPLMTFFFALAHRLEHFQWRVLLGGAIALAGIALAFSDQLGSVTILPLLALVAGSACIAESNVVIKLSPGSHPVVTNAIGMTLGAAILLVLSAIVGESWKLPEAAATWAAYIYLVAAGSVILFALAIFIIKRWTASATSYSLVLTPFVAVLLGALLANEGVSPLFVLGGALVLLGVWVGALARVPKRAEPAPEPAAPKP
jgi:drug/metabolite transporter (DMT)-like permease